MKRTLMLVALLALALPAAASGATPECANGGDDDADGLVDLADGGCVSELDSFEGPLTREFATSYSRVRASRYVSSGSLNAQNATRTNCLGANSDYRCSFRFRGRFTYVGAIRVFKEHFPADEIGEAFDSEADRLLWFRGRCGRLPVGIPVTTVRLRCETARRWVNNWYSRGKRMPSGWRCRLASGSRPAYCRRGGRIFRFTFGE